MFKEEYDAIDEKFKLGPFLYVRALKLLKDFSSMKVWVLGFVLFGLFTGMTFTIADYVFFCIALGIKDAPKILLAFKGVKS